MQQNDCAPNFNLLLEGDYSSAVVHLAWERKQQERTLLLAWVELLPAEILPPIDDGERTVRIQDRSFYVRHVVTTAERALKWYRDCANGIAVRPENDGSLPDSSATGCIRMAMAPMDDEPRWPNMVCSLSPVLPFVANWYACPRVHHLMAKSFDVRQAWTETQRSTADQWLTDQLHFNFSDHEALWGSVHLVAPNPVFRLLGHRLEDTADAEKERILLHLQPRAGHDVAGLQLRFVEQRPTGICVSKQVTLTGPTLTLQFDHVLYETCVEVHYPHRGLLWHEPATSFLRSVVVRSSLVTGKRVVSDDNGPLVTVPVLTDLDPTMVGLPSPTEEKSALVRLAIAVSAHEKRQESGTRVQRWFSGQRSDAVDAVHALIRDASRDVLIVDPYFGRPDLRFALALSRLRVPVTVLTSSKGLQEREKEEPLERFVATVERIVASPNSNPLDVRVMPGAGVHDRFLVVDDKVYLLGSSLNSFGERGTMMIQLFTPESVRAELLKELAEAKPLKQWLTERRASQQANRPTSGSSGTTIPAKESIQEVIVKAAREIGRIGCGYLASLRRR